MRRKILVTHEGALAIVRFDDPERLNALDVEMSAQFANTMGDLCKDASVRAIVLTGEGRAFCAGANLKEMAAQQANGDEPDVGHLLREFVNPVLMEMRSAPKPVIAAVNGAAAGVGCGIALAADIVLAGRAGYFLQSFIHRGVVPDGGSTYLLPRLAGPGRAAAMMMLGEKIDAETALAWGLVHRVYNDGELQSAARDLGARLANGPTAAYAQIKAMLAASEGNDTATQLALEARMQEIAFKSQDCREGIAAFAAHRAPSFKGC